MKGAVQVDISELSRRLLDVSLRFPLRPSERLRSDLVETLRAAQRGELSPDEVAALRDGWAGLAGTLVTTPHLLEALAPVERPRWLAADVGRFRHEAAAPASNRESLRRDHSRWIAEQSSLHGGSILSAILTDLALADPDTEPPYSVLSRWLLFQDLLNGFILNRRWVPLHDRLISALHGQARAWANAYVGGYFYQGHPLLGISGIKPTDERLELYEIDRWVQPGMRVLDVGANCGFLALELARRGARVDGIEINPFLVAVAEQARQWLGVDAARFRVDDFAECLLEPGYDVILSLANHCTIDGNLSIGFEQYVSRLFHLLRPSGLVLFESHDVFGAGLGGAGDDGDLDAKFDIAERYFEVVCHRMIPRFVPNGDIDKLFVVLRRRDDFAPDAVRTFSLRAARTRYEMTGLRGARSHADPRGVAVRPMLTGALAGGAASPSEDGVVIAVAADSKILRRAAFVLHTLDMVNHYREVWRCMDSGSFDVLLAGHPSEREPMRRLLGSEGYRAREIEDVIGEGQRYAVAVANHTIGDHAHGNIVALVGITRVRFFYALGKSAWNFSTWNRLFDAHLVQGPPQAERLGAMGLTRVVQMGYPRYDRLHRGEVDVESVRALLGCGTDRPVVVWLPTWGGGCSVAAWAESVAALKTDFDVVVKPHPLSWTRDRDAIRALESAGFTSLVGEEVDSGDLLAMADFVLADYGGSPFSAVVADRNVVLLDANGTDSELYGQESFDLALRERICGLTLGESQTLRDVLADQAHWRAQTALRAEVRARYLAPHYGFAGRVAAAALDTYVTSNVLLDWSDERAIAVRRIADLHDGWLTALDEDDLRLLRVLARGRRIVGWGTGSSYRRLAPHLGAPLEFLVDGDGARWGQRLDGVEIRPPGSLLSEAQCSLFVVVFSSFREEIFKWLDENGFVRFEDYG